MSDSTAMDLTAIGPGEDWKRQVQWNPNGKAPAPNGYNSALLISRSPSWQGHIRFNEFSNRPELKGK
jgi:hypothetical protein